MKTRAAVATALLLSVSAATFAQAPAPKAPTIEQFMKIRAPGMPRLAADGTLYVRDWPDGINQLYKREPGKPIDSPMTRLTDFKDGISSFSLSPDGKHIIIAAAVGGNEQDNLYLLESDSTSITPVLINPKVVYSLQVWLRDSSGFIYTANDQIAADFYIYRYDLATKSSTKLLGRRGSWSVADVTADGSRLLVGEFFSESNANVYQLTVKDGGLLKLNIGPDGSYNAPAGYLADDSSTMVISDVEAGINRLFARHLNAATINEPIPQIEKFPVEGVAINTDHTIAVVTYNEDGYASMRAVELPSFRQIKLPDMQKGLAGSVDVRGKTMTFTLSSTRSPGEAYAYEIGSDHTRPLTVADTQGVDLNSFTLPELVTYKSFDDLKVPAFLYTPPGYKKGTPIPFVVNFHGGPEGQSRPSFSALTQFLLASGFGVMQPNVRGSTGYGRAYHMKDDYKKRWDSVKDGAEAARWLVKNNYSANGKVAAYGGSYGGFMAVATVIEGADVFGASVDVVGIVNMKTFLEQTKDYRRKLREEEYGPLSDPDFLASISSINRLDEIKCPMLIAHGLNDPRVPVGEAMQLAVGLQKRGYDPELLFFPDEGHGFQKLENRLLFAQRMVKFLQRTIAK